MSSNSTAHINEHIYTFLTSISIVGTIGNLIVAFVYWTKRDKQTSTFFILFLAFIDLTVCSVLVPTTIFMEKIYFETDNRLFCKSYFLLMTTSVPMSSLLMTSIAFDRYFCICMVNRNIMTLFRARIIGVVLLIISASLGVIPALATTTAHIIQSSNLTNTSVNSSFHDIYQSTVEYIFLTSSSISPMQQQPISSTTINNTTAASSSSSSSLSSSSVAPVCRIDPSASGIFGSLVMPFKFFYDFIFIACVITITILYILIYSEIYTRRKAKRDRKRELFYNSFLNTGFNLLNSNKPSSNTANPNGGARSTTKSIFYRIFFCLQNSRLTGNGYFNEIQDEPRNSMAQIIKLKPIPSKENELNTIYEKPLLDENTKLENEAANKIEVRYEDGSSKSSEEEVGKPNAKTDNSNVQQRSSQPAIIRQSSILRRMSLSHTKTVISTKDIRTAFMLFVVSFLYIVFYLPSITATYLTLFIPNFPNNLYISYLYFSNSAINPIIYCFLNPNFRSDLLKLFFKKGFFFDKCNKRIILRSK